MQLLVASGVRVVGVDMVAARCRSAEKAGALLCASPDADGVASIEQQLADASGGLGADRVFLVAGGSSNAPVELAARLARDRATIVDIGKCKLDLPWNAYYEKELEVRFSRSYGPGRYDPHYEIEGYDYPPGYVRWTERRNLQCFLDLIAAGRHRPSAARVGGLPLGLMRRRCTSGSRPGRWTGWASCSSARTRTTRVDRGAGDRRLRMLPRRGRCRDVQGGQAQRSGDGAEGSGWASSAPATMPRRCSSRS